MTSSQLPIAIIGGGPIGLAAAAHLLERGEKPLVFEAGPRVGANVRDWGHVRMFSPWRFNVDAACVRLLESAGWQMPPPDELPTGAELVARYLEPLAALPAMRRAIAYGQRVLAVSRRGRDKVKDSGRGGAPFQLQLRGRDGQETLVEARALIDASGTWQQPNPLGANGLPALGEAALGRSIAYGIPDVLGAARPTYAGATVLVVGSGHSAINTLLDLLRLRADYPTTKIIWSLRSDNLQKVYGGGTEDELPARGQLGLALAAAVAAGGLQVLAPFQLSALAAAGEQLLVTGQWRAAVHSFTVDRIIACTGARPQLDLLRELWLDLDPSLESSRALAPLIDPNLHSCGTVAPHGEAELRQPEKDLYIIGMKSYGRAPTFLLATGYEQARSVAAALCGDWAAARAQRLRLPATGVCVSDFAAACCDLAPATVSLGEIGLERAKALVENCC